MNLAKLSIAALLAGGLTLPTLFASAQQFGLPRNSSAAPLPRNSSAAPLPRNFSSAPVPRSSAASPSEAGNVAPGATASPGGDMSYRDAIGARAGLGWNAPNGTYQAPVPNTPQYQGVNPPTATYSTPQSGSTSQAPSGSYAPGSSESYSQSQSSFGAPQASGGYSQPQSSGAYPAAPPGSPESPRPTDVYTQSPYSAYAPGPAGSAPPVTPPSQMLPVIREDFEHAHQAMRARAYPDAAQWIKDAAARLDQAVATDPYNVASRNELIAARDTLNALAAEILRGRPFDYRASLDRSLDTTVRAWTRFQADQDRAAALPGAPAPPAGGTRY